MENVKTLIGWQNSMLSFDMYCQPGDFCKESLVGYWVGLLPPITIRRGLIQAGEPVCHAQGSDGEYHPIYRTFVVTDQTDEAGVPLWLYKGLCFAGETENRAVAYKERIGYGAMD